MRDNRGYSLFELLISIAIFSLVMLGIISIMNTTSVFYRGGQQEVRLQEEAQVAVNQIEELLIDLDDRISTDNSNPGERAYTVIKKNGSSYGLKQEGERLMYRQVASGSDSGWVLMAEGVTDFEISGFTYVPGTERESGDNRVSVKVDVKNGKYEYSAKKDVYFRNAVENGKPHKIPDTSSSSTHGSTPVYDFIYHIRRGEELNLFYEFNIVSEAAFFEDGELHSIDYFEFIDSTINSQTGITNYVIKLKGTLTSSYTNGLSDAGGIGVEGKDPYGNMVRVLLCVDAASPIIDVPVFQFTTEAPVNYGSPKWIEYKGVDFRGISELKFNISLFSDNNSNGILDSGDLEFKTVNGSTFGTNVQLLNYDVNSLINDGYISAKVVVGVRSCENTGFLQIYQWNDKCEGGVAFFDDGKKYLKIQPYSGAKEIGAPIYLKCAAHKGGFK